MEDTIPFEFTCTVWDGYVLLAKAVALLFISVRVLPEELGQGRG